MVKKGTKITDPKVLDRLRKGRERALEVRRKNATARKDAKLLTAIEKQRDRDSVSHKLRQAVKPVKTPVVEVKKPVEPTVAEVKSPPVPPVVAEVETAPVQKSAPMPELKRQTAQGYVKSKRRKRYVYVSESESSDDDDDDNNNNRAPPPRAQPRAVPPQRPRPSPQPQKSKREFVRDQFYQNTYKRGFPSHMF